MFGFGWRIYMMSPVIFAILSFGLRAGIDSCHISISFHFECGCRLMNYLRHRGARWT